MLAEKTIIDNTVINDYPNNDADYSEAELFMSVEINANKMEEDEMKQELTKAEIITATSADRLKKVKDKIEEMRSGVVPEYYKDQSEEAKLKTKEDQMAIRNELKLAQDEFDISNTQLEALKLREADSSVAKQEYVVATKTEHICDAEDESIIKRERSEYVFLFKANMRRTALATLDMCRVVYEAEKMLSDEQFEAFCTQINYKSTSSTIRKFSTIGKVYPRFINYAEQLPAAWTSIYSLTQIPADDFERCIKDGYALNKLTGGEIDELVKRTKELNNSVSPFKQDKKTYQFSVATVFFTKKVDDTDFRLLQKAFDEISSRLPVKLVVKKEATTYFEQRRSQRYEKLKVESDDVMVKPEKWDYGFAANSINEDLSKLKLAA
jgi:hypothetical protein